MNGVLLTAVLLTPGGWIAIGVGIFLLLNIAFAVFAVIMAAHIVFMNTMVRRDAGMWSRECSDPDPEQQAMYYAGLEWARENEDKRIELHMVNDGLNLYAEYYDLGFDRAVVIVPGRTEGLRYGYYFADVYARNGYNVLTVDQRAHGESDGRYNCIGFDEHRDMLLWIRRLHDEFGVRSVVLHGVCIGAACSLYALTSENAPDYLEGFVAEGMYVNFYESFKNHVAERKKPLYVMGWVDRWMKHYTGHSMRPGPIDRIGDYGKPLLMLHGTADLYSLPEKAVELYEKAGTPDAEKRIVWFEGGRHSRLRLTETEKYDGAIEAFLTEVLEPRLAKKK